MTDAQKAVDRANYINRVAESVLPELVRSEGMTHGPSAPYHAYDIAEKMYDRRIKVDL